MVTLIVSEKIYVRFYQCNRDYMINLAMESYGVTEEQVTVDCQFFTPMFMFYTNLNTTNNNENPIPLEDLEFILAETVGIHIKYTNPYNVDANLINFNVFGDTSNDAWEASELMVSQEFQDDLLENLAHIDVTIIQNVFFSFKY